MLQINDKQNSTFQFSVKLISNKMHEATFKLDITQKQYVDRSYWVVATSYWWIVGNLRRWKSLLLSQNALSEGILEFILNFFCHKIEAIF